MQTLIEQPGGDTRRIRSIREPFTIQVCFERVLTAGVHADFDQQGKLVRIEILDASDVLQQKVQFEVLFSSSPVERVGV